MEPVTENELITKSVAKRVSKADVEARIKSVHYFTAAEGVAAAALYSVGQKLQPSPLGLLTFAVLVIDNGFTVTGQSACASPENFDRDIGNRLAYEDAITKLWTHLGFELRTKQAMVEAAPPIAGLMAECGGATYVGAKCIHAVPMKRLDYIRLRGWEVPADENPEDAGYLVEYTDGGAPNVAGFAGYISWSPTAVFEAAYERMT